MQHRNRRGSASLALLFGALSFFVVAVLFVVPAAAKVPLAIAVLVLFALCLIFTARDELAERRARRSATVR